MTTAQKFLSGFLGLAAMVGVLAWSGDYPPSARADTVDGKQVIVDLPVTGGAQVFSNSLALNAPTRPNVAYRITVSVKWVSATGKFTSVVTTNATGSIGTAMATYWPEHFNGGSDLEDQCAYTFVIGADAKATNNNASLYWNLLFEEDCTIQRLSVQEVRVP